MDNHSEMDTSMKDNNTDNDNDSESNDEDIPPLILRFDSYSPPNRVVNLQCMQAIVGEHLTKCKHCGTSTKYLNEDRTFGVASNIAVECRYCNEENAKYLRLVRYH